MGDIERLGWIGGLLAVKFLVNIATAENPDERVHAFHHNFHVFHIGGCDLE